MYTCIRMPSPTYHELAHIIHTPCYNISPELPGGDPELATLLQQIQDELEAKGYRPGVDCERNRQIYTGVDAESIARVANVINESEEVRVNWNEYYDFAFCFIPCLRTKISKAYDAKEYNAQGKNSEVFYRAWQLLRYCTHNPGLLDASISELSNTLPIPHWDVSKIDHFYTNIAFFLPEILASNTTGCMFDPTYIGSLAEYDCQVEIRREFKKKLLKRILISLNDPERLLNLHRERDTLIMLQSTYAAFTYIYQHQRQG